MLTSTQENPYGLTIFAASTSSYDGIIKAFVQDDPDQLFEVQVSGAFANANIGETANLVYTAGSTHSGTSKAEVNSSTYSTGANTAVKIVGIYQAILRTQDTSSDNCNIIVKFNKHLYSANTAGI